MRLIDRLELPENGFSSDAVRDLKTVQLPLILAAGCLFRGDLKVSLPWLSLGIKEERSRIQIYGSWMGG